MAVFDQDAASAFVSWDDWKAQLERLAGASVVIVEGWGDCYGAGLTPAEAIECSTVGTHRERVIEYGGGGYLLSFSELGKAGS